MRRTDEGKIGGVCAGIADYLGVDVTLVRIAAVVLAFAGPGLPSYLVTWVVMPEAKPGTPPNPVRHGPIFAGGNGPVAGVALLLAAAFVVLDGGLFDQDVLLPALLIGGGIWLLTRDRDELAVPAAGEGLETDPLLFDLGSDATTRQPTQPWESATPWTQRDVPPEPPAGRSTLGRNAVGLLALAGAALWLLTAAGAIDPDLGDVVALGLIGIGVGLVVGARFGRARWLIVPGLVLVVALTAISAIDVPLRGGFGERRFTPVSAADLSDAYRLTAGEMVIDLRSLDLDTGQVPVTASIAAGSLRVIVPENVTVLLRSRIGAGELVLPGQPPGDDRERISVDERVTLRGDEGAGSVSLDLEVGVGEVVVTRG